MDRNGITVRPIPSMLGPHHLNEVFLDDVAADPDDVLGEPGEGWRVIRAALAYERVGIARYARCERLLIESRRELGEGWADLPAATRARWARALVQTRVARLLAYRAIDEQSHENVDDSEASIARIAVTLCDQDVAEVLAELVGPGLLDGARAGAALDAAVEDHWRYARAATVSSGTIEIQRMLVARSVLGRQPA
jgi:alkylation response protein AidB-like acyl-CoA dehydrogenase